VAVVGGHLGYGYAGTVPSLDDTAARKATTSKVVDSDGVEHQELGFLVYGIEFTDLNDLGASWRHSTDIRSVSTMVSKSAAEALRGPVAFRRT
jgi:hypothetical protein